MNGEPWQLRLVKKSIKKKIKLRLLDRFVAVRGSRVALDLGCAQGILSYFVRGKGGFWVSADEDLSNLRTAQELLKNNLVALRGTELLRPLPQPGVKIDSHSLPANGCVVRARRA